jgi:hypothetical protein
MANLTTVLMTTVTGTESVSIKPNWRRSAKRSEESSKDMGAAKTVPETRTTTSVTPRGTMAVMTRTRKDEASNMAIVVMTRTRRSATDAAPTSVNRQVMAMSIITVAVSRSTAVARRNTALTGRIVLTICRRDTAVDDQRTGNNSKRRATENSSAMDSQLLGTGSRLLVMGSRRTTDASKRLAMDSRRLTEFNSRWAIANRRHMDVNRNPVMANKRPTDVSKNLHMVNKRAMVVNKLATNNRKAMVVLAGSTWQVVSMRVNGRKTSMGSVAASLSRVETSMDGGRLGYETPNIHPYRR